MKPARCHYCHRRATTKDHIVPKCLLAKYARRRLFKDNVIVNFENTTVPACKRCNEVKGTARSNCECQRCISAWVRYGPWDWWEMPTIDVSYLAYRDVPQHWRSVQNIKEFEQCTG